MNQIKAANATLETETRQRHVKIAHRMLDKALARLEKLDPDDLTVTELRSYIKDAVEIERKALSLDDGTSSTVKVVVEYVGGDGVIQSIG